MFRIALQSVSFSPILLILLFISCLKYNVPEKTSIGSEIIPMEELSSRKGKKLDEIRYLEFHSSDFGNKELSELPDLPNLEFLSLGGTDVSYLSHLDRSRYPKLATIYLEDTNVDDASFQNWDNPPEGITKLNLNRTKIRNLKWSRKFPKLRRLNIEQTDIIFLDPLKYNPDLIVIWMGRTYVNDLTPIQEHKNLEYIGIDNLWISSKNLKEFRKKRPYTKVVQYTDIHF